MEYDSSFEIYALKSALNHLDYLAFDLFAIKSIDTKNYIKSISVIRDDLFEVLKSI